MGLKTEPPTLFIDNLSQHINSQELRRFFSNQGQIADAYVPHIQRRRTYGRFGFIKVQSREQGEQLILAANGELLGHKVIKVQWPRYQKRPSKANSTWQNFRRGEQ